MLGYFGARHFRARHFYVFSHVQATVLIRFKPDNIFTSHSVFDGVVAPSASIPKVIRNGVTPSVSAKSTAATVTRYSGSVSVSVKSGYGVLTSKKAVDSVKAMSEPDNVATMHKQASGIDVKDGTQSVTINDIDDSELAD